MAIIINATPGDPAANSYLEVAEAQDYFDTRLPLPAWDNADSQEALLIMATRLLEGYSQPLKKLMPPSAGQPACYIVSRTWTGLPATPTQRLSWPRIGMFDGNNNPIDPTVIPDELKQATAEFAGQLAIDDRTLDNDVITKGITSIKAGSVALTFKQSILPQVTPDAVLNLLIPTWLTDELYLLANAGMFDIITGPTGIWDE